MINPKCQKTKFNHGYPRAFNWERNLWNPGLSLHRMGRIQDRQLHTAEVIGFKLLTSGFNKSEILLKKGIQKYSINLSFSTKSSKQQVQRKIQKQSQKQTNQCKVTRVRYRVVHTRQSQCSLTMWQSFWSTSSL